jgi:guanylate kinase
VRELVARVPGSWLARSWTTRPRREHESPVAYHFVTREEFEAEILRGGFLEWASFNGNLYGTPRSELERGDPVVLEIDVQGARSVLKEGLDPVVVGILPPSFAELARRMRERGDDASHIERRIALAHEEVDAIVELANHLVVNDRLGRALEELIGIVAAARRASPASESR